jgi:hypothetical protein
MDMQIEQLNENIAKSLRIILNCADDDLVRAARDELSEGKKDLLDALDVLGVYYHQKRSSRNNLIPTPEFAFYGPYMKILDKPEISEKYDYYCEEKRVYEKTMKKHEMLWHIFQKKVATTFLALDTAEVLAASDESFQYTFYADINVPAQYQWRMKLSMTREKGDDVNMEVIRPNGIVLDGRLIFCGNDLSVKSGKTSISYDSFHNTVFSRPEICFVFKDGYKAPGFPVKC